MGAFEIGEHDFLLDGEPLQIVSGALHYFRIHPGHWADRIRSARAMGLNTIETYVPWNFHAPEPDAFDLTGRRDLGAFLDLVAAEGLHAIIRPGPYICAEWDGGGLPAWLFADPEVGVRRHEPRFLAAIGRYYAQLLPVIAVRQVDRGGPVLMVQVENEYGAYEPAPDEERPEYLRALVAMIRAADITVPLFTSDQPDDEHLRRGGLPELHKTANFGSRALERLATLRRHQPTGPLMCMEFWNGWFDMVREFHHVTSPEANAQDLDDLLRSGASVNLYMAHGGTNFGLTNGANDKGIYRPVTTSYDYDAPIAEHGTWTAKFDAFREVIGRYRPAPQCAPRGGRPAPVFDVALDRRVPLADLQSRLGEVTSHDRAPTHDAVGAWNGFVQYSTRIDEDDAVLVVEEIRDRALVTLDSHPVGVLACGTRTFSLALPSRPGELSLLVEDQGRVNYGDRIGESKGIIGPVRTSTRELTGWTVRPLRFDKPAADGELLRPEVYDALAAATAADPRWPFAGPVILSGSFGSRAGEDHFLAFDGWTRGLVWINGFCLGRYSSAGPTRTLYVPGPLVRQRNDVVVFELHGAARARLQFVARPDLGPV